MTFPSYVQPGTSLRSASIRARVRAGVPAGRGVDFIPASFDMFRLLDVPGLQPRDAQQRRRVRVVKSRVQGGWSERCPVVLLELDQGARKVPGGGNSCRVGAGPPFMEARTPAPARPHKKAENRAAP